MSFYSDASLVMIPSGYKASKVYSAVPTDGTGDLTFTRSNDTATRVGPDGLIEKVRTNVLTYSQAFDNAAWSKLTAGTATAPVVTANHTTAPDGTTTAERVQFSRTGTASGDYSLLTQNYTTSQISTGSVYLKSLTGSAQNVLFYWSLGQGQVFSIGTDWTRIELPFTSIGLGSFAIGTRGGAGFNAGGDLSLDFAIWGAQLETGDIATDYIATTSAAVSVGPVANVPRLDYLNSSCPRLILEGQRTNLVTYSESFDNAAWTKSNATITANAATSPDGYTNADLFTASATNGILRQVITTATSTTYSISLFVKKNTSDQIRIDMSNVGSGPVWTFSTESFTTVSGWTSSFADYGNGWYRISATRESTSTGAWPQFVIPTSGQSVYVYGCTYEQGAYATSYIPTLGSASTRGSDAASKTGISSLIGSVGTLFVQMKALENGNTSRRISLSDGTLNNRVTLEYDEIASRIRAFIVGAGVASSNLDADGYNQTNTHKIALVYNNATLKIFIDGALVASTAATMVPTGMDRITTFTASSSSNYLFAELNQLLVFPTALSDADAIALTA